ncbi:unnamed protein product [Rotaria sp. Silwood2]|nr:unnamed protein product [Rotaria sp. Silwood2]CAF2993530.1 unnamed protein product [Rotaria sp. Silwood2]CAF4143528.1 unnamed protein product [Rotaria sp. Silwood2]CAF4201142.1 unnamed protein product [Rotaria sp. Silwood2]
MNNNGTFNSGPPAALMSFPFSMPNPPQHPPLMEQPYMNQPPQHFQSHPPQFYNPRPTMQTPKSEKRKQEILTCDACGIEVNSQQMMDAHIRGQKHIKKMKLKTVSTVAPTITQTSNTIDVEQKPVCSIEPITNTIVESAPASEPNPPSAPVVKTPLSNEKSVLQLMNELAKFNKVNAKYDLIKETGPAHCKQFEVRLTVADESYTGIGTSIKRAQQIAAEQALATTALKKPELSQRSSHSVRTPRRGTGREMYSNVRHQYPIQPIRQKSHSSTGQQTITNNENLFQNLINNKCAEIIENENTINILHCFVEDIERALKTASDKIMEQCKLNNISVIPQLPDNVKLNNTEQLNEDPCESFRMLKGAMKVSTLAMRLFLKNDYEYSLVLICANKPTVTLLNEICQELTIGLNAQAIATIQLDSNEEQSKPITYQVQANVNDACLTVQCSLLPKHTIRIMLTSPVFRSENFLNLDDSTRQQIAELNPDPSDMLDKNKCLEAAAEIRHSNWFTRCMLENNSNLIILRLLRDLQYNQTPLSSFNLWCLALLVYKCQNQPPTSSTNLFRAVFACLSSGILLPNHIGPGIIDPCEKELVDAAAYLTLEQRLNITSYAQNILRLISFEKYETIFHIKSNETEQLSMSSTLGDNKME